MLEPGKIYEITEGPSFDDSFLSEDNTIRAHGAFNDAKDKILILKEVKNYKKVANQTSFYWIFNLTKGKISGLNIHVKFFGEAKILSLFSESRFEEVEF